VYVRLFELKAKGREEIGDMKAEELSQPITGRHHEVPGRWRISDQALSYLPDHIDGFPTSEMDQV
jgi:hypothetical protein